MGRLLGLASARLAFGLAYRLAFVALAGAGLVGMSLAMASGAAFGATELDTLSAKVRKLEKKPQNADKYLDAYYEDLPAFSAKPIDCARVLPQTVGTKFVLVGDEHNNSDSGKLLERVIDAHSVKPTVMIEFIFARHQKSVDEYLAGKITLAEVRKRSKFDSFGWAWKWEEISHVLVMAKERRLRVLAGEEGSNNMKTRDLFTVNAILNDLQADPMRQYVILYGTSHLLGRGHLADLLRKRSETREASQVKIVNFLGSRSGDVIRAAREESALCFDMGEGVYYQSQRTVMENLKAYYGYLAGEGTR